MATIGETMASLRASGPIRLGGDLRLSIAGSESTVAIGLARLGYQARWIGVVGDDELGVLIVRTLRAEGVQVDDVRVQPDASTGLIFFEPRMADIMRVTYHRKGSAGSLLEAADVEPVCIDPPAILHVTGITPALSISAAGAVDRAVDGARRAGALISLDVNYRASLWSPVAAAAVLAPLAARADLVLASEDELALVAPDGAGPDESDMAGALRRAGVGEVVITRGGAGATVYGEAGTIHRPAVTVGVVDTAGAGDAFAAGYLSAVLESSDIEHRLERAVRTAGIAVGTRGDWEGLPTLAELTLADVSRGATLR